MLRGGLKAKQFKFPPETIDARAPLLGLHGHGLQRSLQDFLLEQESGGLAGCVEHHMVSWSESWQQTCRVLEIALFVWLACCLEMPPAKGRRWQPKILTRK